MIGDKCISVLVNDNVKMNLPYRNIRSIEYVKEALAAGVYLFDCDAQDTYPIPGKATRWLNRQEYGYEFMVAFGPYAGQPEKIFDIVLRKVAHYRGNP